MAFKDYSTTPSDNTELGDGTYIGPNMLRNKVRPALQQLAADGKALADDVQTKIDISKGDPGAAGNVAANLAQLKAAATTNVTMLYTDTTYNWTLGDFTGQADDLTIIQADGVSLAVGAWVRQYELLRPEMFRSSLDADDTASIERAILRAGINGGVDLGTRSYTVSAAGDDQFAINLLAGQTLKASGAHITHSNDAKDIINVNGKVGVSIIGPLWLNGARVGAPTDGTVLGGAGIRALNSPQLQISHVNFRQFHGLGLVIEGPLSSPARGNQGGVLACTFEGCAVGYSCVAGSLAEYFTFTACNSNRNWIGAEISAGNVKIQGGSLSANLFTNLKMTGGANHGHGIVEGVDLNHVGAGGYSLWFYRMTLSQTLGNVHIYDGDILFDECSGIEVDGGHLNVANIYNFGGIFVASIADNTMTVSAFTKGKPLSAGAPVFGIGVYEGTTIVSQDSGTAGGAGTYTVTNPVLPGGQTVASTEMYTSGYNYFQSMQCPSAGGIIIHDTGNSDASRLRFSDMRGPGARTSPGGININDVSFMFAKASRQRNTFQTLSAGEPMIFPVVDQTGNRHRMINSDRDTFTVQYLGDGNYEIALDVLCAGTNINVGRSYLQATITGAGTYSKLLLPTKWEDTTDPTPNNIWCNFRIYFVLYLNAGDTVQLLPYIEDAGPSFGNAAWESEISMRLIQ